MPYLGSWKIDDYLTFCCNTHDPDTGVATDADSVPTYRVYEDETATPILTGSTAKLDDANTTGFYSERIQLTAANGFEKGKCYTIYISATVDSDTGTMHHSFQVEAEVDCNTASDLHADLDDGGRLDLLIDAIKAVTDNLPDSGALSSLATAAALTTVDTVVDAIKAKTDNLPTDPADDSDIDAQLSTIDTVVDAIKAVTDALNDPTAAAIADAVLDEALSAHDSEDTLGNVLNDLTEESDGTYRFTEAALAEAPTGAGAGAITFTYTLTSSVDGSAVADAQVWVTSDLAGSNVLASGTTDANGQVVFYLDAGTVYVWRQKSGWNFTNPDTETVA